MHQLRVRPRLLIAVALAVILWFILPVDLRRSTRAILSLDLGGAVFLALSWTMMSRATPERMRLRARMQDEGRWTILLLTVGAAIFSLAVIAVELHGMKDLPGDGQLAHLGLAAGTIVCSWLVTHTMFALHYAHAFYGDGDGDPNTVDRAGGLDFPATEHPDYWDFLYFSFVVGMTGQTSDVQIRGRSIRRLCLAQGVLAFFFNTVILALSINIAAGLL
ncbi:DUF1345 domain-containing protein [Telmatospirillum siberiense]|uniref:DUF1345 domain-containing protein n=1 Tax=Telmatospirillum siberiense TaxID=382514 RepID=A0A2N3PMN5_9PROT|nr:DUF1345 domain-containing protein [Telmatospirillum siberiense]